MLDKVLNQLSKYEAPQGNRFGQPVFLFLCGGDDSNPRYICRKDTERFVEKNKKLGRVVTVKPEILLNEYNNLIEGMNLLELETVIAELSDAILLFDESPGSVCELGAFTMSQPIREIMTACVPLKNKDDLSFIIQGPIRHLEACRSSLSNVFYIDIECPFNSIELSEYLFDLEAKVRINRRRKVNKDSTSVNLGSFCRECLDIISIFSPISDDDLLQIYKGLKGFNYFDFSMKVSDKIPNSLNYKVVIAYLASTGLVSYKDGRITMTGHAPGYFMFQRSKRKEIQKIRAEIVARKRKHHEECVSVCS